MRLDATGKVLLLRVGAQGLRASSSSGRASSGSGGEGQGSKSRGTEGARTRCVVAAGTGAGSCGLLVGIVHLGDGGGHMSPSAPISHWPKPCPTGHQVTCTSSVHTWVLSVEGGVPRHPDRCHQPTPVRGEGPSSREGQEDCKHLLRGVQSQLLRKPFTGWLLRAGHSETALSLTSVSLVPGAEEETSCHLS